MNKFWIFLLISSIFLLPFYYAVGPGETAGWTGEREYVIEYNPDNPESFDWKEGDLSTIPAEDVNKYFDKIPANRRNELSSDQLAKVDTAKLGDLGQYDSTALTDALKQKGYDISNLNGNLDGATITDNTLTLKDGSKYDLKSGKKIELEIADDGSTKYFSDNAGTSIVNGKGVEYTTDTLEVQSAGSVEYHQEIN